MIAAAVADHMTSIAVADAEVLPFGSGTFDVICICGSAAHFPDMETCFAEVRRCLRPDGLLVVTEEVSLVRSGIAPRDTFRALHPEGVFTFVTPQQRVGQLSRAGLDLEELRDLTPFGTALLGDRLKALRLFQGTAEGIFGVEEVGRLLATLVHTIEEYQRRSLAPAVYVARPSTSVDAAHPHRRGAGESTEAHPASGSDPLGQGPGARPEAGREGRGRVDRVRR